MPAVVWEESGRSFRLGEGRVENSIRYFVTDSFSEGETLTAISLVVPSVLNGLFFLNTEAEEVSWGLWKGTANYGIPTGGTDVPSQLGPPGTSPPPPPPPAANEPLGPEWSFTTTGGTQHIVKSIHTRQATAGSGIAPAPDHGGAIGVGKDGVSGCDKVVAKFEFTKTVKMPQLSLNYLRVLTDLTGKTNDDDFLGGMFRRGEVLYLGADGNYRDNEGWSVVHRFSASPNKQPKNPNSTDPDDRLAPWGHDFIWFTYEDQESEGSRVSVPYAGYVEQVYEEGDFDELGI